MGGVRGVSPPPSRSSGLYPHRDTDRDLAIPGCGFGFFILGVRRGGGRVASALHRSHQVNYRPRGRAMRARARERGRVDRRGAQEMNKADPLSPSRCIPWPFSLRKSSLHGQGS